VAVTCILGFPTALVLGRVRRLRVAAAPLTLPQPEGHKRAPVLGGLLLWLGVGFAFVTAFLLANGRLAANGYVGGWRTAATLLGGAFAFGFAGLFLDCVRIMRADTPRQGTQLPFWLQLTAQLVITGVFLAQQLLNGHLSTAVCIAGRWVELGAWYYPLAVLLILAVVNAVRVSEEPDGVCAGGGFVAALIFLILAMLLLELDVPGDRFVVALFAAAVAGGCIGFLFWNFFPARLRPGSAGSMFLGGALVSMAWGLGRPELLVLVCGGYLLNALGALLCSVSRKKLCGFGAFHNGLEKQGWNRPQLTAALCGVGVFGGMLAILSVFLHG
jgi:phospho-N-acetylmuramoyl-pentapeptide-transferase